MGLLPKSIVRGQNIALQASIDEESKKQAELNGIEHGGNLDHEVHTKFIIDSRYQAKGVGLILGGTVLKGLVKVEQIMMFGPDKNGNFRQVIVKGIHENRVNVDQAGEMSSICVNVKTHGQNRDPILNNQIRKGSCLINPIVNKKASNPYQNLCVKYFDANIKVLHHHTTIQDGYQGVLHIGGIRSTVQAVKVHHNENTCMRTGDEGTIRFKFKYGVEFVEKNAKIMVREGNTKAYGYITRIYPMNEPPKDLVDKFTANDAKVGAFAIGENGEQTDKEIQSNKINL